MEQAYLGDPRKANRLQAARKSAGYRSARAAAPHFGWSASTYAAHETASRYLGDDTTKIYAAAFNVDEAWLMRGDGEGPQVDTVRAFQFISRIERKAKAAKQDTSASAFRRLRLAGVWQASRRLLTPPEQ